MWTLLSKVYTRTHCRAQATLLNAVWQPGWERSLGENGYMDVYGWVPSLFTWNYHNIVNRLKKKKKSVLMSYHIAQGTLFSVMWQPGQEGSLGKNGYMYMYGWVALLSTWNYHNIVNWLYSSKRRQRIPNGSVKLRQLQFSKKNRALLLSLAYLKLDSINI